MMSWISQHPAFANCRNVEILTGTSSLGLAIAQPEVETEDDGRFKCFPSQHGSFALWYMGHWLQISRSKVVSGGFYAPSTENMLHVRWVSS